MGQHIVTQRVGKPRDSGIKKNELLPFTPMWMDLQNIMLSETSQREKDKYCMISLIYGI